MLLEGIRYLYDLVSDLLVGGIEYRARSVHGSTIDTRILQSEPAHKETLQSLRSCSSVAGGVKSSRTVTGQVATFV